MEKVKLHTQVQRSDFCDSAKVKRLQIGAEKMVQDSKATAWADVAGCKIQAHCRGGVSESKQHVVAHRRGWREAQLARGGIREHYSFLGNEI